MDTHQLERSVIISSRPGEGEIIWNTPYAQRLYYGETFNFDKSQNPNAGPFWFERAKAAHLSDWERLAQRIVDRNL